MFPFDTISEPETLFYKSDVLVYACKRMWTSVQRMLFPENLFSFQVDLEQGFCQGIISGCCLYILGEDFLSDIKLKMFVVTSH